MSYFDNLLYKSLEFVDAASNFALGLVGRGFKPQVIDLGENAVLAGHPAVAEDFVISFISTDSIGFLFQSRAQLGHGGVERCSRVILEFGNGVRGATSTTKTAS